MEIYNKTITWPSAGEVLSKNWKHQQDNPWFSLDRLSQILHSLSYYVLTSAWKWLTWGIIAHFLTESEGPIQKSDIVQFKWHSEYKERGKEYVNKCWKVGNLVDERSIYFFFILLVSLFSFSSLTSKKAELSHE